MKSIKIQNKYIPQSIEYLQGISLCGAQSRVRSKVVRKLIDILEEMKTQENELIEEFTEKGDDGNPIMNEVYLKEHSLWMDEIAEVQIEDNHLSSLKDSLENSEELLSGKNAEVYDVILDAIEKAAKQSSEL